MIERDAIAASLVIIASTPSTINGSASNRLRLWMRPDRPSRPGRRATGMSRLSARYCLSCDRTSPDRRARHRGRLLKAHKLDVDDIDALVRLCEEVPQQFIHDKYFCNATGRQCTAPAGRYSVAKRFNFSCATAEVN